MGLKNIKENQKKKKTDWLQHTAAAWLWAAAWVMLTQTHALTFSQKAF